jgi:hypothetical protein
MGDLDDFFAAQQKRFRATLDRGERRLTSRLRELKKWDTTPGTAAPTSELHEHAPGPKKPDLTELDRDPSREGY